MGIIKCNNCMKEFEEEKIVYDGDDDTEYCPFCGESGYLMDINEDETLFSYANELLKKMPYQNWNKHADFKCLFSSEHGVIGDESTLYEFYFFVEKDWLEAYAASNYNVRNLKKWLDEIYTSDESDKILEDGIKAGVVAQIYRA